MNNDIYNLKKRYDLLLEKSFPSDLYHVTDLNSVASMVKNDEIILSFANIGEGPDKSINEDKFFFLSLSYDKWGRYASSDRELGSRVYVNNVILVFDSFALQSKGKLINANYWNPTNYKDDEKEVRYISDKQVLNDISKYIKEIHIYVDQPYTRKRIWGGEDKTLPSFRERDFRYFNKIQESDVPTYFYDDHRAFKLLLKRKSHTDYTKAVPKEVESVKRTEKSFNINSVFQLSYLIHAIDGTKPEVDRFNSYKRLIKDLKYNNDRELKIRIENDLHNAKSIKTKDFQKIVDYMKKNKLKNTQDLIDNLRQKY